MAKKMVQTSETARDPRSSRNYVETVSINFDRLENLIRSFSARVIDRVFWWTPLSIALSLLFTLVTAEFKSSFAGVSAEQWRTVAILGVLVSGAVTVVALIRAANNPSLSALMDKICADAISRPRHYGIALFKGVDGRGVARFLAYFDDVWGCYLLPYVRLHEDQADHEDVSEPAADRFGLSKDELSGRELQGHVILSEKVSAATGKVTNYRFAFYIMKVVPTCTASFRQRRFEVQSRRYEWLTIEEALADPKSAERNGDVFRHLRDHYRAIFQDSSIPNSIDVAIK